MAFVICLQFVSKCFLSNLDILLVSVSILLVNLDNWSVSKISLAQLVIVFLFRFGSANRSLDLESVN